MLFSIHTSLLRYKNQIAELVVNWRAWELTFQSWWWTVPLLLLVFVLGAPWLNADNLWHDEVWSLEAVGGDPYPSHGFSEIWHFMAEVDKANPPVYFMLLGAWGRLVGWTPFAGRMFSLLWGALTVAMVYRLGVTWFTRRASFFAVCVLSSSAFFVFYTHELRAYTWLTFLTTLTLWIYWQVINRTGSGAWLARAGLFFAMSGLIYTNYFGIVSFVAVGMWHLTRRPWNRSWWQTAIVIAGAGMTFLPWLVTVLAVYERYESYVMSESRMTPGAMLIHLGYVFSNTHLPLIVIPAIFALSVPGNRVRRMWFLFAAMMLTYLTMNLQIRVLISSRFRYFLPLWPVLALLVGVGFDRLPRRDRIPELLLILWVVAGIWYSQGNGFARSLKIGGWWDTDWQSMTTFVAENGQEGDAFVVLAHPASDKKAFEYYTYPLTMPHEINYMPGSVQRISSLTQSAERLWIGYVGTTATTPGTPVHKAVEANYALFETYATGENFQLNLYVRPPANPLARFGPGVIPADKELQLDLITPLPAVAGDDIIIDLIWSAEKIIAEQTYTILLSLVDVTGSVITTELAVLARARQICTHDTLDLSDVTPGTYQIQVGVLLGDTLLPGYGRGMGYPVERVTLGSVVVPKKSAK